ncbi:hypothetical protein [Nocardia brasiliensis]|uniref:hypothetical protein n=1 Tax=Nocardia brasiliensis TaxID=37326 RepID=UPI001896188A|nr:hypothetical protein [Nocardia brasiliensis]MBF6546365.1 hypothetical protein [Nocardia brasiliensis]
MHANPDHTARTQDSPNGVLWTLIALVLGLIMLIVAFTALDQMPGWADEYGAVPIYLALFLWMSIAGRLTWRGIDALVQLWRDRK